MSKFDCLKIENQLCFPLYAASRKIIREYKQFLEKLDLTYTQYITMMILWENKKTNVKELGEKLFLDSGTLTPLLRKLEVKGYIKRERLETDERNLIVSITKLGEELKSRAVDIPNSVSKCIDLNKEDTKLLYGILYKILLSNKKKE